MTLLNRGVALVTNAAQGPGRAIALRLASEGFKVAVHDSPRNGDQLIEVYRHIQRLGEHSCVLTADLTMEDHVQNLVKDASNCLGGLNVMIANTQLCQAAPITSTTEEIWNHLFKVNAQSIFWCYKQAAKEMISQGNGGRIIGSCSVWGKQGGPSLSAYSASQFAIRGLTESAALDLSEHGITVNAYALR
ncbi:hypothetical protein BDP27DRAFT_1217633 [Rhodocollybia butyracea]|uniref:NAD(P)-binding protein n=1 Tax=Rhodocollybia butyracea TaxID=206335 RepID=A0A9P5PU35_9AGAR|nr:hypothetical protein BDP27DRAFT_1217633 [Rhodocollybia butyracea]